MSKEQFGPIGGNGGSLPPKDKEKLQKRQATESVTRVKENSKMFKILNIIVNSKSFVKVANIAPFVMLAITVLTTFLRMITGYSEFYAIASQLIGYSVLTNLVFLLHAVRCRYSDYSIIAILSLLALNINQIIAIVAGFDGHTAYIVFDAVLIVALFLLCLRKFIKK